MPVNQTVAIEQWERYRYCRDQGHIEFLREERFSFDLRQRAIQDPIPARRDALLHHPVSGRLQIPGDAVAGARDIRLLTDAGYTCEGVTVLDLFPNTPHVEMVSAFSRNA